MKHSLDAAAISPPRGGTTPYYVMELMMQRHAYAVIFLWVVLFGGLSALLVRSDDLQYDCFSFCDTGVVQSCSGILHTANSTDVSWRSSPSHCLQAPINASAIPFLWSSQGPFSSAGAAAASSSPLLTLDAIPDMSSTGRRIGRFVLRFDLSEYTTGSVSSGSPMNPKVRCVKVLNVSTDEHSGAVTSTVLPTPLVLGTMSFDNILVDVLVPGGSAAIVFELPIGYRFPEGTQQLVIEFPGGPPLVPLAGASTGPFQLTFATSSPTYLMYEVLARYVLLGATCVLVLLVLCLHALADTTIYEVFHTSVPTFAGWLACFSAVSCVTENESLLRTVWPRQPMFIKGSIISLCIVAFNCDPLSAVYYAFPENLFLQFWNRTVMPWVRLTWIVLTSSWVLWCLVTCGDHGAMYAGAASLRRYIRNRLSQKMHSADDVAPKTPSPSMIAATPLNSVGTPVGSTTTLDASVALPSGLIEELDAVPRRRLFWRTTTSCSASRVLVVTLALLTPVLYLFAVMVAAVKGEYDLQPQITTTGNYNHDEDTAGNVTWIGALTALPMLGIAWYYHQRTLFARFPKGVADMSSPASFGVPSHRHNTRPFVIAARYLMPFCIAATFFLSYAYILTYMHLSYLLPSYNNGHLVEVLLTGLLGWTVAVALVPIRKSLATHPPRPCIYPPKWSTSFDPAAPLWCQLPWRSAYDQGIASGVLPNCGYAFLTEEHEAIFHRAQREFRIEQLIGEYHAGVQKRHEQHPSAIVPPSRSFFCWETAVRCVNISNETYNDLEGDVDLVQFTRNETYEPDEFEACVVQNCCCCVTTMLMSGGGCAGEREEDDVLPTEAAAAATFTTTPTVPLVVLSQHHQFDYERTPYVMGPSKRRFGEAGAVAVDPSGGSARKQRSHRRTHHHGTVPNDRDEDDALNGSPRKTSAPHVVVVSFEEPSADHSYHPLSSSTSPTKTPKKNINTAAASPSRRLAAKRPPPILVVEATLQATSHNIITNAEENHESEPPTCCVTTTSDNLPGPSPAEEVLATTHNSASSSSAVPLALVNLVAPKGQINVSRYGYQLIKVLDVFGVRVLIAATPPNTSGRHPHLSIAFRGTVNIRNALTNVNARTLEHPEMKQSLYATNTDGEGGATSSSSGEAAEVHSGFWGAFQQILPTLASALHEFYFPASINATIAQKDLTGVSCPIPSEWAQQLTHVVVTGHSLGGVLAMLCAYSIARGTLHQEVFSKLQVRPELRCYTFGSPRLGNAYLSNVYASAVPETYRVINENDVISHVGLCWHEYNGREVRINRDGDAVIEGTYLETCFASSLTQGVGSRFKNHLLDRYGNSFDNCLCSRNLRMLSPECCSFMMVHVDQENNHDDDGDSCDDASSAASDVCDTPQ